ncbi:hypothetical protein SAMN05661093_01403 [Kibdelosporangium aridum]|uniref:Uncharacterized protein n=1 Tax=Kibdelosporangium aridum TaxID=2030 RepID=A0A1W2B3L9_KIBAR|nr:hypothetical protein SAMN05661093_01403 [Kibdelosporangium aridum]
MRRNPEDRPTAAETKQLLAGDPVKPKRPKRMSRRARAITAAGTALVLVGGVIFAM